MHGRIEDEPLPGILHRLLQTKATGILAITNRTGKHELYFREGHPVHVVLPGSAELIGKVLKDLGVLNEAQYRQTLEQPPQKGQRFGDMLLERNMCTPDQLRLALKAQTRRKLHRLFFLGDGEYRFEAGDHDQGWLRSESLKVHPWRAIYHGVRAAWTADRLDGVLFIFDGRALRCPLDPEGLARFGFGNEDGKLAELMRRGYWTLGDLVDASGLQPHVVHALVYALYITESLDVKDAREVSLLRRQQGEAVAVASAPRVAAAPAAALRVGPSGTTATSSSAPPPPDAAQAAGLGATGPSLAPEIDAIRAQIITKAKVVENETLFEVLGLQPTAGRDDVKKAYFDYAKRYHPDRMMSMGLEALRPDVEKIFRRVSEAYGTLFDDARREQYKQTMGQSTKDDQKAHAEAMKLLEAEMSFRRGELALKRNDFASAIRELEAAVAGNPTEGEHLAYLAYARVCGNQMTPGDAKLVYAQAIKMSPRCARAHFFLGVLLKNENDLDRAYASFKKALELDARLIDAEREMRLINMRREKDKDKTEKKGLFDRFRKK